MTTHGAWYHVFVPLTFNDGRPIPDDRFDAMALMLNQEAILVTETHVEVMLK